METKQRKPMENKGKVKKMKENQWKNKENKWKTKEK